MLLLAEDWRARSRVVRGIGGWRVIWGLLAEPWEASDGACDAVAPAPVAELFAVSAKYPGLPELGLTAACFGSWRPNRRRSRVTVDIRQAALNQSSPVRSKTDDSESICSGLETKVAMRQAPVKLMPEFEGVFRGGY